MITLPINTLLHRFGKKGKTWYVRPSGGSYGDEDGTSYDNAWDGFSNIDWTSSGVKAGDTLYVCGTHTELLTVGASGTASKPITILGNYSGDAGVIDSEDTRQTGFKCDSKDYITITSITSIDALLDCFEFIGTSIGIITNDIVATGSGDQGLQHEDTVSVTHNNPTCSGNADDGISGHGSAVIVVNGGTFTNNGEGINVIENTHCTVTGSTTFTGNTNHDIYAVLGTTEESCWIDVSGATFTGKIRAAANGKLIIRNCTASNTVYVGNNTANKSFFESYDSTINGTLSATENAEIIAYDTNIAGTLGIGATITSIDLYDCSVTNQFWVYGVINATRTVFLAGIATALLSDGTFNNCLVIGIGNDYNGVITFNECRVEGSQDVDGTLNINHSLMIAGSDHILDLETGSTLNAKYSIFKGMAAGKYAITVKTGSSANIDGCTFVGSSNVGHGVFAQVPQIIDNCIFTDLDTGILTIGSPSLTLNNCCSYGNNTDISGAVTNNDPQTTDPKLSDVANNDFSLDTGSSCLGTGKDLGESLDDGIDTADWGNGTTEAPDVTTKQQTAPWDVGAYVS